MRGKKKKKKGAKKQKVRLSQKGHEVGAISVGWLLELECVCVCVCVKALCHK